MDASTLVARVVPAARGADPSSAHGLEPIIRPCQRRPRPRHRPMHRRHPRRPRRQPHPPHLRPRRQPHPLHLRPRRQPHPLHLRPRRQPHPPHLRPPRQPHPPHLRPPLRQCPLPRRTHQPRRRRLRCRRMVPGRRWFRRGTPRATSLRWAPRWAIDPSRSPSSQRGSVQEPRASCHRLWSTSASAPRGWRTRGARVTSYRWERRIRPDPTLRRGLAEDRGSSPPGHARALEVRLALRSATSLADRGRGAS